MWLASLCIKGVTGQLWSCSQAIADIPGEGDTSLHSASNELPTSLLFLSVQQRTAYFPFQLHGQSQ